MQKAGRKDTRALKIAFYIAALVLQGCALYVSHYDAGAYQYFTSLKAYHIKFLEDNKAGEGKHYDEVRTNAACDTGELKFREASEYANGKQDATRVKAIEYLHNVFTSNCKLAINSKKMFGSDYADQQIEEVKSNYDLAIAGESDRVGAPSE